MVEFLSWVASRPRTYAEAMEAWRSNCPRHTVWEDALVSGLIKIEGAGYALAVRLTPQGQDALAQKSANPNVG